MAVEQYANLCSTVLTANYTAGAGSIQVGSTGSPWPSSPQFHVYVAGSDGVVKVILKVTAITDSTHWAVTAEGSDANATSGDTVKLSLTAGAMDQIRQDIVQTGALVGATSQKAGNLYFPNNGIQMYRDSGSAMVPWGPIWPFSDPTLQSWTQTNFGSCTSDTSHGGLDIHNPTAEGSFQIRSLLKNTPSTPYHCEFGYIQTSNGGTNYMAGACFSDGTKYEIASPRYQVTLNQFVVFYCTTATSYSSTVVNTLGYNGSGAMVWLRLGDDGTNKTFDVSCDGFRWINVFSEGRTTNLTASKVGLYLNGGQQHIRLLHYKETS